MSTTTTETSPKDASEDHTFAGTWRKRSMTARLFMVLAFIVPVILSFAWSIVLGKVLPSPSGFGGHVLWWVIVAGGALLVALFFERLARRVLPMAMLLRLSLVFPDSAPSRFSMALRSNSARQLKRRIEAGVLDESSTPQQAATTLLELSAALSVHDRMTRGHAERVRAYSMMIGQQLDLSEDELAKLQWGALLHDVGKLDVSAAILNKPGAPDSEELKSLRAHPDRGREYMRPLEGWLGEWALTASQHHERFDGTGYPNGLAGEDISLAARIVAVADAYDVMTSTRSYKTAMDPQEARAELLHCSHTQFDADIVRAFLSVSISELRRPFQAAMGAGALASLSQLVDLRTVGTAAAAIGAAVVGALGAGGEEPPPAIAFVQDIPAVIEILEDSAIEIPLRTTLPADSYTVDSVEGPATATVNDDILLIEPFENASGMVTVAVTACSSEMCDSTSIVAEVISVNDAPSAASDEARTSATDTSISIPVLANDTDADSAELSIQSATVEFGEGTVTIVEDGQNLLFTPERGSLGPWSIEYVVTDNDDGFDRGTVTILNGDLAPEAGDDLATVVAGESVTVNVRANDTDDGDMSELRIVDAVVVEPEGTTTTVEVTSDGQLLFNAGSEVDIVVAEYTLQDGLSNQTQGRVLLAVTPPTPIANDDVATTSQNTAVSVSVLDNDGPAILDLSTVSLRVTSSSEGSVSVDDGVVTYTPPVDAAGEAAVTYEICSATNVCDRATVRITVTRPVSPFAAEGQITLPSDAGPQLIPWLIVSSGAPTPAPGTSFNISTDRPQLFSSAPSISSSGSLAFTPANGASGTANSTITVTDSNGRRQYRLEIAIR